MKITKNSTIEVHLNEDDLKEAVSLYLKQKGEEHKEVTHIIDVKRSEYEPIGNTEGETYYYFDGVKVTVVL